MAFLPIVTRADYRGDFRIHLVFNDGVAQTVDLADWLERPVFEPLRDRGYFERDFIDGLAWPNGADIAPEALYELAKASAAA